MPASRDDLAEKAAAGTADVVCLDLEDGVAPDAKPGARKSIASQAAQLSAGGKRVAVRINAEFDHISLDLACLPPETEIVVLSKTSSSHQIAELDAAVTRRFGEPLKIVCLIESASALEELSSGRGAWPSGVFGVCLGTEDFAANLGTTADAPPIQHAFQELALLAARRGVCLFGYPGSIAEFRDLKVFRTYVDAGRQSGAIGGLAIHPRQVDILNEVFAMSNEEIDLAKKQVEAFEKALEQGVGAINVDGRMVDKPVYLAAKRRLALN